MTTKEAIQVFLPVPMCDSQDTFLELLEREHERDFACLHSFFIRAFKVSKAEQDSSIIRQDDSIENGEKRDIASEKSEIELSGSLTIVSIDKAVEYDNTDFTERTKVSIDKTVEYDIKDFAEEMAKQLFEYLKETIITDNNLTEIRMKLWNYYRQGIVLLPKSSTVRSEVQRKINNEYFQSVAPDTFWWYAMKFWKEHIDDDENNDSVCSEDYKTMVRESANLIWAIKHLLRVEIPEDGIEALYYTSLSSLDHVFPSEENGLGLERIGSEPNRFYPSIMSVSAMNDPEEGHILQEYLDEENMHSHRYWWNLASADEEEKQRYYSIEPYIFCKSLTNEERLDDLSMWEIYGDRSEGVCCHILVHDSPDKKARCLYNIAYINRENKQVVQIGGEHKKDKEEQFKFELLDTLLQLLKEIIKREKHREENAAEWRKNILEIAYLFKYESYSHENEMRYLCSLVGDDVETLVGKVKPVGGNSGGKTLPILSIKSQVSFEYKEVILGPKVKNTDNAAAYLIHRFRVAIRNDDLMPTITKSAIHYR